MLAQFCKKIGFIVAIISFLIANHSTPTFAADNSAAPKKEASKVDAAPKKEAEASAAGAAPKKEAHKAADKHEKKAEKESPKAGAAHKEETEAKELNEAQLRNIATVILMRDMKSPAVKKKLLQHGETAAGVWGGLGFWQYIPEGEGRTKALARFKSIDIDKSEARSMLKRDSLVIFTSESYAKYDELVEEALKSGTISLVTNPNAGGKSINITYDTGKVIGRHITKEQASAEGVPTIRSANVTKIWIAISIGDVLTSIQKTKKWNNKTEGLVGTICPAD